MNEQNTVFLIWDIAHECWVNAGMEDHFNVLDAMNSYFSNREDAESRMKAWQVCGEVKSITLTVGE